MPQNKLVAALRCHSTTPCAALDGIEVEVSIDAAASASVRYTMVGNISQVRLPARRPAERKDELWRHTCCELFLATTTGPRYLEFNFSPSSEWAAYRFEDYRQGMQALLLRKSPLIDLDCSERQCVLTVNLDLSGVELASSAAGTLLALSAVIEETEGRLSYWALAHPSGKPDFHHRDGFT